MGVISLVLPFAVSAISSTKLSSISISYYTEARDIFVGFMFVVSVLLLAYNGHTDKQKIASKLAALTAVLVALFPTSCNTCPTSIVSVIHYSAAVLLFLILSYFCLGPFRKDTKGKSGKKGRRGRFYFVCGWVMLLALLGAVVGNLVLPEDLASSLQITYWAETVALFAFGVAWTVASKFSTFLAEEDEILRFVSKE